MKGRIASLTPCIWWRRGYHINRDTMETGWWKFRVNIFKDDRHSPCLRITWGWVLRKSYKTTGYNGEVLDTTQVAR